LKFLTYSISISLNELIIDYERKGAKKIII